MLWIKCCWWNIIDKTLLLINCELWNNTSRRNWSNVVVVQQWTKTTAAFYQQSKIMTCGCSAKTRYMWTHSCWHWYNTPTPKKNWRCRGVLLNHKLGKIMICQRCVNSVKWDHEQFSENCSFHICLYPQEQGNPNWVVKKATQCLPDERRSIVFGVLSDC